MSEVLKIFMDDETEISGPEQTLISGYSCTYLALVIPKLSVLG